MKGIEFPIIGTKVPGVDKKFDLNSPGGLAEYFEAKAGDEISHLKNFLEKGSFIAYLLGKKNSGKGTYAKLFAEIFGEDKVVHLSVGDLIREVHSNWDNFAKGSEFGQLKKIYRGYISFDKAVDALHGRSTAKLLPTEFILALLKVRIAKLGRKAIFVDGLPRESDQVSFSLYFRDLVNYRDDPDIFVLIDIPEAVISERIKYRVVCPICRTSRNIKLLITSKIEYEPKEDKFYLVCDNPKCRGARMVPKEGDILGIAPIRQRLLKDEEIMKTVMGLHGVSRVLLRNHVPVSQASEYFDDYEITPQYSFELDSKGGKVKVVEEPWIIKDDNGVPSLSLLAPPVLVTLLKQLPEVLGI